MTRQLYVVLGLSRSGTSAITRSLSALGVQLGEHLQQADDRNPKGFFEDLDIMYKVNRGVSELLQHEWMTSTLSESEIEKNPSLCRYKEYAVKLINERLDKYGKWGFKDPRTIEILPFWKSVFKAVGVDVRYIIMVRHPVAVAQSISEFTKSDYEINLALWAKSFYTMLEATQNERRVLVNYEMLIENPRQQVDRIYSDLQMGSAYNEALVDEYVNRFLDKKLNRHQASFEESKISSAIEVIPVCKTLYVFARELASGNIKFNSPAYDAEWTKLKAEYLALQPAINYILTLRKQNVELSREMRTLQKSVPWRLVYPLRVIDDMLRKRRRASRHAF